MNDPRVWSRSTRSRLNTALFTLNVVPLLLLRFRLYVVAVIVICAVYLIHHYFSLSKYNLSHVPRLRINLYAEWPISYLIVFVASFLSEGWGTLAFFVVLAYQVVIYFRLAKLMVQSYYSHKAEGDG